MMGNSLEQHRASIGAFNASSKRRRRIFSSRSSNLVSIAAPIHHQLLLFGVLGLLNSELLLSTAVMIGFLVALFLGAVSTITSSNCSCDDSTKTPAALAASAQLCGCLDVSFSAGFTISVFSSGSFLYDRVRTMLSKFSPLSASCKKREMSIQATAAARPDIFNVILSAIVYLWSTSRHQMVTL